MNIIVFLIVFGIIVTFHEWGHYYFAKRSGVHVYEFAVGMGPKIFQTFKNGTLYTIRALPLGGYVRMAGESDEVQLQNGEVVLVTRDENGIVTHVYQNSEQSIINAEPFEIHDANIMNQLQLTGQFIGKADVETLQMSATALMHYADGTIEQVAPVQTHFYSASVYKRMLISVAGPVNNFILSIVVFSLVAFISGGVPKMTNDISVAENMSAYEQGLRTGDKIIAVNGTNVQTWSAVINELNRYKQTEPSVTLTIQRDGQSFEKNVPFKDQLIGITNQIDTSVVAKISYGFTETWTVATSIWKTLLGLISRGFNLNELGGPVAIVQVTGTVVERGFIAVLTFLAFISANLGVMNLLPIPGLDGGNILLNIIEILRGKPISREKQHYITIFFMGLLILLMIAVTFNDILRLFQ